MTETRGPGAAGGTAPGPSYFRAIDPFPLESAEQNKLHAFYDHLAAGRLTTTVCRRCRRQWWPPRGFCPDCVTDELEWVELPREGTVHAFSVQETGAPPGFAAPLVFAIVKVGGHRIFAPIVGAAPDAVRVGGAVRFTTVPVAADATGAARHLAAFRLAEGA